jgi:hypothetical protein
MPVIPPICFNGTFLYMKPMEQLYLYDLVQTLMFSRVLYSETENISNVKESRRKKANSNTDRYLGRNVNNK